ncbi:Solute carrier family 35 member B1 [Coccomyxa sp. Obi]|nr:Solute carrier family 35 member B1 [Coccomyxa sp. Obi]
MANLKSVGLLLLCAGGIYASYLTQGVVQEVLATKKFGPENRRFTHLKTLNGVQSVACFVWAAALLLMPFAKRPKGAIHAPWTAYWKPGITNSIGPALGSEALKNISYPAQVLAKSCKMIPVMLMGTLIGGKFYSTLEYGCAVMIAAGISLFARQSSSKVTSKLVAPNAPLGYGLCALNLLFDGYTNATQDVIHKEHKDTSALWSMCWMNFWCSLYNCVYLFVVTGAGWDLLRFCMEYPEAGWHVALFCLCGAIGQLFIFGTIKRFGSLVNTLICTTRKFFNILLSVLWNGNPLLPQQWLAVFLVFAGLLTSSIAKSGKKKVVVEVTKEEKKAQ